MFVRESWYRRTGHGGVVGARRSHSDLKHSRRSCEVLTARRTMPLSQRARIILRDVRMNGALASGGFRGAHCNVSANDDFSKAFVSSLPAESPVNVQRSPGLRSPGRRCLPPSETYDTSGRPRRTLQSGKPLSYPTIALVFAVILTVTISVVKSPDPGKVAPGHPYGRYFGFME